MLVAVRVAFLLLLAVTCPASSSSSGKNKIDLRWFMLDIFDLIKDGVFDYIGDHTVLANISQACRQDILYHRQAPINYLEETLKIKLCGNDTECQAKHTLRKEQYGFFITQLDSQGRIPPGVKELNRYWLGSYRECIGINVPIVDNPGRMYQTKYCNAMLSVSQRTNADNTTEPDCPAPSDQFSHYTTSVQLGICMPKTCSREELTAVLQHGLIMKRFVCNVFCVEEPPWTTTAIAMIIFLSVMGGIMLITTIVDYTVAGDHPTRKGKSMRLIVAFSMYSNGKKILDLTQRPGQMECLHGIRVLSMFWVVLGHTYLRLQYVDDLPLAMAEANHWSIEAINNATFSVDTFFVMSGFLVAYLWLKEVHKTQGRCIKSAYTWIMYYVHRYIRLTPVYMIIIIANAALIRYIMVGPSQFIGGADTGTTCSKTWWTNLLYINNLVYRREQCYGVAWYLPNDTQFYALAPIFMLLLLYKPLIGAVISVALILGAIAAIAATIVQYNFPAMLMLGVPTTGMSMQQIEQLMADYMAIIYEAPWFRFPPYLIGILFGFLWHNRLCKIKPVSKPLALVGWCLAFAVGIAVVYGMCYYTAGHQLPVGVRALYGSVCRSVWGLCICWVMYACLSGVGGPINEFLSWRGWMPISRLSYCMYLLHYMVIEALISSNDIPIHWDTHFNWISKWVSTLMITMFCAFFVSCALEAPVITLERLALEVIVPVKKTPSAPPPEISVVEKDKSSRTIVSF